MNCNALDIDKEDIAIYDYIKVCVENIASIFYNDKNHSKTEEGLKQFIKINPKMNIFKQAPNLNYWFISKKNLDKLLFVNAKNNVVNVHEYCQEVELNYITDGYNYNKMFSNRIHFYESLSFSKCMDTKNRSDKCLSGLCRINQGLMTK